MSERWLRSLGAAAKFVKRHPQTIREWITRGWLPSAKQVNGRWWIDTNELLQAAGKPEMVDEIEELITLARDLQELIRGFGQRLAHVEAVLAQQGFMAQQHVFHQSHDDLSTVRGVGKYLARHGVKEETVRYWDRHFKNVPLFNPRLALQYASERTAKAGGKAHGRVVHQCDAATFPDCTCHDPHLTLPLF
jgi:hypothetical protein